MHRLLAAFAWLCLAAPATALARPFTLDDYARLVSVSDPEISPDGRSIVAVVGRSDYTKDQTHTELVLIDVASGAQRVLTLGRDDVASPRWSPDGTQLAFAAPSEGGDHAAQVWVMPMNGGDARTVTNAKYGVEVYAWRPDGKAIAYVTQETPPNEAAIERHEDLFNVGDEPFSATALSVSSHLWLQQLSGGAATRLTQGNWSISPGALSWSADGKYIAFDELPDARFDSIFHSRVAVLDIVTGQISFPDERFSLASSSAVVLTAVAFAPSGDRLAYTAGSHGSVITQDDLDVTTVGEPGVRDAAPTLDRNIAFFAWSPGGGFIAAGDDGVSQGLWRISPDGTTQRVDLGDLNFNGGSVAQNGAVAFTASSAQRPSELYYLAPGSGSPRRLTDENARIAALDLAPAQEFTWHNDGFDEDGVLTYPLGYHTGVKYPLVLDIHGGPILEASTTSFDPRVQLLAARGFVVFQPNYRGSDNLGFAYADAIIGRNPMEGVGTDCVAGLRALEATGGIDESRIGVSGYSAGGWATSWLITHYDLWRAAVSGAAVDDVVMESTLSEIDSFMPLIFGGLTPWSSPGALEAYRDASPITYVQNVHAATLILVDSTDPRAPTPQSYEFFSALRNLGKVVQLTVVPAYGHHPSDPVRNREIDRAWVDWMVKYLSP